MSILPQSRPDYPELFVRLGVTKAIEDDGVWIGFLTLTPERAKYLLSEEINHSNREMTPTDVDRYERDMHAGRWTKYGSMMGGVGEGMTDGQKRSQAVLNTGLTQKFVIALRREGDEVWYDLQRQRSVIETLSQSAQHAFAGEKRRVLNPVAMPLAMNLLWMRGDYEKYRRASRPEIAELMPADPELTVWAANVRKDFYRQHKGALTSEMVCGLIECFRADADEARQFASDLCLGHANPNAPASVLQRRLNGQLKKSKAGRANIYAQVSAVVYAFDAYRDGRLIEKVTTVNERFVFPKGYNDTTKGYER
jgi:hypothetical protein